MRVWHFLLIFVVGTAVGDIAVGLVVWSFQLECDRADCSSLAEAVRDQLPLGLAVGLVVAGIVSFVIPRLRVALRTAGRAWSWKGSRALAGRPG